MINSSAAVWATPKPSQRVGDVAVVRRAVLVVQRDFLESRPPTGERPEGVPDAMGVRWGPVGVRRNEQAVIGEIVEGFSQDGRGLHDDLLQRVHRRGARFHGGSRVILSWRIISMAPSAVLGPA